MKEESTVKKAVDNLEKEAVQEIVKVAKENIKNGAIGRYQGWGLIFSMHKKSYQWIQNDYQHAQDVLSNNNVHLMHWSSLSYDSDDSDEYAVRYGVGYMP